MVTVIFINGAPHSGKDTLGKALVEAFTGFEVVKFAQVLKERTHALYGYPELPHDHFENCKDEPNPIFLGLTPRAAYINVSENLMKPAHGDQVYGELLVKKLFLGKAAGFVITDSGFESEAVPVIRQFGISACLLVRIRAEGRGCTFKDDSRSYVSLPVHTIDIRNDFEGETVAFINRAMSQITPIIQQIIGGS